MKIAKERSRWRLRSHQFTKKTKSFLGFLLLLWHIFCYSLQFFPLQMKRDLCYNERYTKIHRKEGQAHDLCAAARGRTARSTLRHARQADRGRRRRCGAAVSLYPAARRHGRLRCSARPASERRPLRTCGIHAQQPDRADGKNQSSNRQIRRSAALHRR